MATGTPKAVGAFRTIGEVSDDTGVPQHILRYWETRFPQLRPVTRAGNRRYYRPDDIALVRRIDGLLNREGYTIRGVQQVLAQTPRGARAKAGGDAGDAVMHSLRAIRDGLAAALQQDERIA
jgi:DNA-binding transcriptional MerR regulator